MTRARSPQRPPKNSTLTTRQVGRLLGLTMATVSRHCARGALPGAKQRGARREWGIPQATVDRVLERQRQAKRAGRAR